MPELWLLGGWWFVPAYVGALIAATRVSRRHDQATYASGVPLDADGLDRYERAMFGEDGELGVVRLAIVDLLHEGVLVPGEVWDKRSLAGEPAFTLVAVRTPDADAHPLQREIATRVGQFPPLTAEQLFQRLSGGGAIEAMRRRLVAGGLLYGKRAATWSESVGLSLLCVPYLAFFAWIFISAPENLDHVGWGEVAVNVVVVMFGPLVALAVPLTQGATSLGKRVRPAGVAEREPLLDARAHLLTHAWETRTIVI